MSISATIAKQSGLIQLQNSKQQIRMKLVAEKAGIQQKREMEERSQGRMKPLFPPMHACMDG